MRWTIVINSCKFSLFLFENARIESHGLDDFWNMSRWKDEPMIGADWISMERLIGRNRLWYLACWERRGSDATPTHDESVSSCRGNHRWNKATMAENETWVRRINIPGRKRQIMPTQDGEVLWLGTVIWIARKRVFFGFFPFFWKKNRLAGRIPTTQQAPIQPYHMA